MATYFVDDGGDNSDGSTWAKAYTSIQSLDTAVAIASGDIIYIGADSVGTDAAAALTITGPASGLPVYIISSTVGSGTTVSYSRSTTNQILATGATSDILFDGSFALFGVKATAGRDILLYNDGNESFYTFQMTAAIGPSRQFSGSGANACTATHEQLIVDLSADGTTVRSGAVFSMNGAALFNDVTFVNPGYRTGTVFSAGSTNTNYRVSGADISGFTNGTECEIANLAGIGGESVFSNCKTKSSVVYATGSALNGSRCIFSNVGPADAPTSLAVYDCFGTLLSSSSIYRTGGATVEGDATGWLITTTASCGDGAPFYTPWIYGTVSSTGTKTFDVYITNDTVDLTDAECWLEVEAMATADVPTWTLTTDKRATITTTAAAQTDDTTSTWNGTGPSFTYKQKLSVTATVGESGQYRARVAVGKASIASSSYFYIDPKVTVT